MHRRVVTGGLVLLLAMVSAVAPATGQDACAPTFQGHGDRPLTCLCTPAATQGAVWGTDIYTDDSSVCAAARHAGAIGADGGVVTIHPEPGQDGCLGSTRNGVETRDYGAWTGSFTVQEPSAPGAPSRK